MVCWDLSYDFVSLKSRAVGLLDVFLRRVVLHGSLTVVDHQGNAKTFGTSGSEYPDVTIRLNDSGVAVAIVSNPTLGAGEAYMDGRFSVDVDDIKIGGASCRERVWQYV